MLLLATVGASFLLYLDRFEPISQSANSSLPAAWVTVGILLAVALLSSGTLSRPVYVFYPDYKVPWKYVFSRIADLENQGLGLTGLNAAQLRVALMVNVIVWLTLAIIAVLIRSAEAVAVIIGPMLLLIALRLCNLPSFAFQMIGIFYPLHFAAEPFKSEMSFATVLFRARVSDFSEF
jgi:hypothetical protein